jgi:hypothetical protein
MPLETISCSHCGSAEVKEVKANTYFCDHCETIFKHIDPNQVTVQREFCECGGPIAFQCRVCHVGICAGHDVWPSLQGTPIGTIRGQAYVQWGLGPWVPTTVPAYRLDPKQNAAVRDNWRGDYYIRTSQRRNVDLIRNAFPGGELHLCSNCLEDVFLNATRGQYDELARSKVVGTTCADPCCQESVGSTCLCCKLRFCTDCIQVYSLCRTCRGQWSVVQQQVRETMGFTEAVESDLRDIAMGFGRHKNRSVRKGTKADEKAKHLRETLRAETERRISTSACRHVTSAGLPVLSRPDGPRSGPPSVSGMFAAWAAEAK